MSDERDLEESQDPRRELASRLIVKIKEQLACLESLLEGQSEPADVEALLIRETTPEGEIVSSLLQDRAVEGVFDGEQMIGEDGRKYSVPQNYASKSKLVEGDLLRLTITNSGRFMFKQKGPIERQRVVGMLVQDEQTQGWKVVANGNKYQVLAASISYYKGQPGDDVVILIPCNTPSRWAAVENIIKQDLSAFDG